jgi:hypothetical protein
VPLNSTGSCKVQNETFAVFTCQCSAEVYIKLGGAECAAEQHGMLQSHTQDRQGSDGHSQMIYIAVCCGNLKGGDKVDIVTVMSHKAAEAGQTCDKAAHLHISLVSLSVPAIVVVEPQKTQQMAPPCPGWLYTRVPSNNNTCYNNST